MTETQIDEVGVVREWRYGELRKAGFTKKNATLLAEKSKVDLHQACDMLKTCGDEKLVVKILL